MNSGLPSLLDAIFGKKELSSVSLDELNEVISEFPSFNAAHFLLSKKLKDLNGDDFQKENMRTALYFNNPFWLQTLLNEEDRIQEEPMAAATFTEPVQKEENLDALAVADVFIPAGDDLDQEEVEILEEKKASEPEAVTSFDELMSKYKIETDETELTPLPASDPQELIPPIQELPVQEQSGEIIPEPYRIPSSDYNAPHAGVETREPVLNEYGIFEDDETDYDMEAFDPPAVIAEVSFHTLPVEIQADETESIIENSLPDAIVERMVDHDHEAFDRPANTEDEASDFTESLTDAADNTDIQSGDMKLENHMPDLSARFEEQQRVLASFDAKKAEAIVFAPYHMIDYFASQGIKLVLEDQPADSFGKQLKSFTDWLKVMKKLPTQPLSQKSDEKEADRIRHFAAHSVEERDILTESMAEVLAKQGMYENAIALYQKLSLIYPPKSAYFASRIEQLKASSS